MTLGIINPDSNRLITVNRWKKETNPQRANLIAIIDDTGRKLVISKECIAKDKTYKEAQEIIRNLNEESPTGTFRLPTRRECLDIYDASLTDEFAEAVSLIHGNMAIKDIWTADTIPDEIPCVYNWTFDLMLGTLDYEGELYEAAILPVLA